MSIVELFLYAILFVLIGWTLVSLFLIWQWFDVGSRLKVVREVTREQTVQAIRHSWKRCKRLVLIGLAIAIILIAFPFLLNEYYGMLTYSGVIIVADVLILLGLRSRAHACIESVDEYVLENEEHVREAAAERARQREEWIRQAPELNPKAEAYIKETLGDNYETWFQHDILVGRNVLANMEEGLLYAQGVVLKFSEIMEVRPGRKDLKLVTTSSMHPFVTIDFGALPINPETGNKYMDEIAIRLEKILQ